jgi:hypothetical protein
VKRILAALLVGALFGFGLVLARMSDPNVVLGFLDFAGRFDPTLLIVFASALGTTLLGYRFVLRRPQPLLDLKFHVPTAKTIDRPLVTGAIIFGVGWGLAGYCPGPGLVGVGGAVDTAILFFIAMIAGSLVQRFLSQRPRALGASESA